VSAQPWGVLKLVYTLRHLENEIQSSKGQIRYEIKRMILNTLITTAGFIFISLLLVYMLSTRFSSPLIYLAKCAGDISRGDFSVTRHIRIRSMDEVGVLSAAFIGMGEDLKRSYDRLEEYNRTLEQKVRERTRELDEKNHRLLEVNHQLEHTLEELRQSQAQLVQSEKMAALGHLIAGIAHEINTPLGVIRGAANNITSGLKEALEKFPNIFRTLRDEKLDAFVDLLQESISRDDRLSSREARQTRKKISRELENHEISATDNIADYLVDIGLTTNYESYLIILREPDAIMILHVAYRLTGLLKNNRNIITAVERASKIVFALKKFAHYDHVGEKVSADIVDGLETVLTLYHNQLKHGVEITRHYEEIPPISCHPDELNQVWTNLIHNALQAMENKGRLDLSVFRQNGQVVIAISDTGPGIPEEIRHRIFEPFFTTKAAGEGSGLGLDISKKIIEKHQGSIDVESQPGKTTFRVILPVLEPGEKQDEVL
jgi:signal transduction histidine kinase